MKQEEKDLLLKDLCARLFNGVIVDIKYSKENGSSDRLRICSEGSLILNTDLIGLYVEEEIHLKPYLRPMSSMTEEEKIELYTRAYAPDEMKTLDEKLYVIQTNAKNATDFYNEHHLDYRGLIEKGLALEAPEDIYK